MLSFDYCVFYILSLRSYRMDEMKATVKEKAVQIGLLQAELAQLRPLR
jgi:hypothetical protein